MKDRLAGAPGRYSATIAPEEYEKIQAGENFHITMMRDDDPIVEGTPYSKAAVLPDALAEQLCPGIEDPTPADALMALLNLKTHATEDPDYPGCFYRIVDGEKEWLNPPMVDSIPYRTTERFNGKAVYTILQDLGALPVSSTKEVLLNSGDGIRPSEYVANVFLTSGVGRLHCGNTILSQEGITICRLAIRGTKTIEMITYTDMSDYTAKLYSKYTLD